MLALDEETIREALASVLLSDSGEEVHDGIDEDIVSYLAGMLHESGLDDVEESIGPFLEGYGCPNELVQKAFAAVTSCGKNQLDDNPTITRNGIVESNSGEAVKLNKIVSMQSTLSEQTTSEIDQNRYLWGQDNKVAAMTNAQRDAHASTVSAKDKRKARKELEAARKEYEAKMAFLAQEEEGDAGKASVSHMVLPDYKSGRNEKDIHMRNVSLSLDNGTALLDDGELKLAHKRRYGLVGKNGVGKTTLLKAIAAFEIEGMPRHHRILHVRQEIRAAGGDISVLQAVMEADVERNTLLEEEKTLVKKLEGDNNGITEPDLSGASMKAKLEKLKSSGKEGDDLFNADLKRLDEIYERLQILGAESAESRASTILSGLQFTPAMQSGPTSALSGGWRMRVALAAALFIEPGMYWLA
jgi:energy-coupling factor transporter ATP-binding protein EcfA2